jgi:glycosyltransferase involved in cell wall biosynthesis
VLCHDVGPVSHPHLFDRGVRDFYKASYDKIKARKPGIVFVSNASKAEFCARFGTGFRFMAVIPLYARTALCSGMEKAPEGVRPPFIFTASALEKRKNYLRIFKAFTELKLHQQGYSYVFCGPKGNDSSEIIAAAKKTPGVTYLGCLADSELRWLYRRSEGFVLPSLLEGFGVPALEAAKLGALPLVSDSPAQREAAGDSAIFVDPLSVEAIADGLKTLVSLSVEERADRLQRAQTHAAGLSKQAFIARWREVLSHEPTQNHSQL